MGKRNLIFASCSDKNSLLKSIEYEYIHGVKIKDIAEHFNMSEKQISYIIRKKLCLSRDKHIVKKGITKNMKGKENNKKTIIYDGELDKEDEIVMIDDKVYKKATVSDLVKRANKILLKKTNKKVENNQ